MLDMHESATVEKLRRSWDREKGVRSNGGNGPNFSREHVTHRPACT